MSKVTISKTRLVIFVLAIAIPLMALAAWLAIFFTNNINIPWNQG